MHSLEENTSIYATCPMHNCMKLTMQHEDQDTTKASFKGCIKTDEFFGVVNEVQ